MSQHLSTGSACLPFDREPTETDLLLERHVFGANVGISSYTTIGQADRLADVLGLGPDVRLLEIGAGLGWPSLYLAERTGCEAVLTDRPAHVIPRAVSRASDRGLHSSCSFALADGRHLPLRPGSLDAVVHTDVL